MQRANLPQPASAVQAAILGTDRPVSIWGALALAVFVFVGATLLSFAISSNRASCLVDDDGPKQFENTTARSREQLEARPILIVTPAVTQLRNVARGGKAEARFRMSNPTGEAIRIGPILTSCDCLTIRLDSSTIEPAGQIDALAIVDLEHEPDFRGGLLMEADALDIVRRLPAFRLRVEVFLE